MNAKSIFTRSILFLMFGLLLAGLGAAPAAGRAPAAPGGVCDNTTPVRWEGSGHWYLAVCAPGGINWQGAKDAATARYGYLATPTSAAENAFVASLTNYSDFWYEEPTHHVQMGPWLGAFQNPGGAEPAGGWQWVTGEEWVYTNWWPGDPNDFLGGNEDWMHYYRAYDRWNDLPSASLMLGYIIEWVNVLVQDEEGQPVPEAQVFRNGELAGTTDELGMLYIEDLAFDDALVARLQVSEWNTAKGHHSQDSDHNWAYRTYITSLEIPRNGEPTPFHVIDENVTQVLTLKDENTLIGFNIVASVEWDATQAYLAALRLGFERASAYLYDASDGQMLFEQVTIYDNAQAWNDADYQVKASNQQWPQAYVGVVPHGNRPDRYTYLGRYFDGGSANQGAWTLPNGYRTLIHEFGHYGLALFDSYFRYDAAWNKIDAHCTSVAIRNNATPGVNATLMYYQFNATEFAMRDVAGLWSADCINTYQYQVGGSDWETIRSFYSDKTSPARWTINTPADHGGVVAGPTAIPVEDWSQVAEPVNVDNGACTAPSDYFAWDEDMNIITPTVVTLVRSSGDGRVIVQGANDKNGRILILGAGEGDQVHFRGQVAGQPASRTWDVTCPTAAQSALGSTQSENVILLPDPFLLAVSAWPGVTPQAISVTVQTTATLSAPPEVFLQQTGLTATLPVTLTYDGGLGAYVGGALLDPAAPQAGILGIVATDTLSQSVTTFEPFSLSSVVISETSRIWSPDGRAELYLATGALSADGRLNISPVWAPGEAPEGMLILGSPYTLRAEEGLSLVGGANLSIFYEATVETRIRVALYGATIYRWDGAAWVALDSTSNADLYYASAAMEEFGTYALMTSAAEVTVYTAFLPIIGR